MSRTSATPLASPNRKRVRFPPLHAAQAEVFQHPARFKVVVCGRQWGKTTLGAVMCLHEAIQGRHVWWVAPSFPIGDLGWAKVDELCRQYNAQRGGVRFEGRPIFRITFPTGGTIQLRSADNPDSLRGATLDFVVFDEAAQAKASAWPTLEPTLAVRNGRVMFISTPRGTNWFHEVWEQAEADPDAERWQFPSSSSPFMTPAALESAKRRHSSLWFSQEYEAEFISTATGMFRQDWIRHYRTAFDGEERLFHLGETEVVPFADCTKFHTVDLAWSLEEGADYTVIASWAVTPKRHLVLLDVIRGHFEGPDIIPRLRQAYDRWGGHLVVERTTRQMHILQEAQRTGLPIREVRAEKDKVARALPATARMEQGRVWFPEPGKTPWFRDIEEELLAFPAGRHDDFIDCLSYAVAETARGSAYADHDLLTV